MHEPEAWSIATAATRAPVQLIEIDATVWSGRATVGSTGRRIDGCSSCWRRARSTESLPDVLINPQR